MNNFFLALTLICLIAIIIGIIKPRTVLWWWGTKKRFQINVLKYYGIGFVVFFVLFLITANHLGTSLKDDSMSKTTITTTEKSLSPTEQATAEKVADEIASAEKENTKEVIENQSFIINRVYDIGNIKLTIEKVDLHRLKTQYDDRYRYYIVTTFSFVNTSNEYLADFNIKDDSHFLNNLKMSANYDPSQWKFIKDQWIGTFGFKQNDVFKEQIEYQLKKENLYIDDPLSIQYTFYTYERTNVAAFSEYVGGKKELQIDIKLK